MCQLKTDSQLPRSSTCRTPESEPSSRISAGTQHPKHPQRTRRQDTPHQPGPNPPGNRVHQTAEESLRNQRHKITDTLSMKFLIVTGESGDIRSDPLATVESPG